MVRDRVGKGWWVRDREGEGRRAREGGPDSEGQKGSDGGTTNMTVTY